MPIAFSCHSCGRSLNVRDELTGKQIYCPDCKSILTVPAPAAPEPVHGADDIPMAAVAEPAADPYGMRAEEPKKLPRQPPIEAERDEDDWVRPAGKPQPPTPHRSGGSLGAIFGGLAMLLGTGLLIIVGLASGLWLIKLIIILGILGVVTFFRGLFGMGAE